MSVLLLVLFVMGVVQGRNHHRIFILSRGRTIGTELIATTNSDHVVHVGEELRTQLAKLLVSPTKVKEVTLGDGPLGNGTANVCITIENKNGEALEIRIKQSSIPDKFDILGFWTIARSESH